MINRRIKNIEIIVRQSGPIFSSISGGIAVELGHFHRGIQTISFSNREKIERCNRRRSDSSSIFAILLNLPLTQLFVKLLVDTIAAIAVFDTSKLSLA